MWGLGGPYDPAKKDAAGGRARAGADSGSRHQYDGHTATAYKRCATRPANRPNPWLDGRFAGDAPPKWTAVGPWGQRSTRASAYARTSSRCSTPTSRANFSNSSTVTRWASAPKSLTRRVTSRTSSSVGW